MCVGNPGDPGSDRLANPLVVFSKPSTQTPSFVEQPCVIGSGNIRSDKSPYIFGDDDATTNRQQQGADGASIARPPAADGSATARTRAPVAASTKCAPQLAVDTALNRGVPWHQAVPRGVSGAGREILRLQRSAAGITSRHGFTGAVDSIALPVCVRERGLRSRRGRSKAPRKASPRWCALADAALGLPVLVAIARRRPVRPPVHTKYKTLLSPKLVIGLYSLFSSVVF